MMLGITNIKCNHILTDNGVSSREIRICNYPFRKRSHAKIM